MTSKQKLFVERYLIHLNATKAAIEAGYSEKNANKIGPELLGKTRVKFAIEEAQQKISLKNEITREKVIAELAAIAFGMERDNLKVKCLELLGRHFKIFDEEVIRKEQDQASIKKRLGEFLERIEKKH